jgi:hypothetical protein
VNSLCEISEECKIQARKRIRLRKWITVLGLVELENQKLIRNVYTPIDGILQSKFRILETGD